MLKKLNNGAGEALLARENVRSTFSAPETAEGSPHVFSCLRVGVNSNEFT
jgi:hypothetical protein